ncbi:serine/threonine-protein kinase 16 [Rhincodon typus]|uniref:serine/threonine-protein kinase 16 n=1 Tax=Rhincodon typus TaxID=259920 RepID=UPI002030928F|nr:serine/threonine-protein kinase 16 [Rhincodon typus]
MGQTICICSRGTITIDNKRYFFIQKLDEGGFSYVDLVESVQNGKFYALKRIICHDKEDRKNALNEVEMHRMFNHPNILHLEAYCIMDKGPKCEGWLLLPYIKDWAAQRCTISYRAPELFNVASHCIIDERTDIWSLGCVLYAMMFLEGPYDGIFHRGDSVALAVQNVITIPEGCRYTQALQHLLTSTMVTNPQERPNITWVLNQTKQLLQIEAVQETKLA